MDCLKIGFIKNVYGIKGELKVLPLTDNPNRFKKLKHIYIFKENSYTENSYNKEEIEKVRLANNIVLLKLKKYDNRETASSLKGSYIYIDRKDAMPLNEGEFFTQDIINCDIFYNRNNIGRVIDVLNFGANDNLVIKTINNKEVIYPFVKYFLEKVDIINKRIIINQYEGFFD